MTDYGYSEEEWQALLPWVERPIPIPPAPVRTGRDTAGVGGETVPAAGGPGLLAARVRGMLLGLAVGDSLGNTSEGMSPEARREAYGEIRDYLPNRREEMLPVGLPSDDTQLAFWTLESLLHHGRLDPADLAERFTRQDRIFGIGATVTGFLFAYRFGGRRWFEAGRPSAGNGALMRIAPVILLHLRDPSPALWVDVIAATILTHRDQAAVAASVGFVGLFAECLARRDEETPPARWWPDTFLRYARPAEVPEGKALYRARLPGDAFRGSLCDRVEQEVLPAVDTDESLLAVGERWHSGAYLLETVPSVLLLLARHGNDPEEAIVRAVNDSKDNDTVAAVVGAAVGALHGEVSLPARWREGLLGRTREDDDGQVQELTERAVEAFVV
jgi:ADP-ribosylglycohydrolase